jgi:hypothetical protein
MRREFGHSAAEGREGHKGTRGLTVEVELADALSAEHIYHNFYSCLRVGMRHLLLFLWPAIYPKHQVNIESSSATNRQRVEL